MNYMLEDLQNPIDSQPPGEFSNPIDISRRRLNSTRSLHFQTMYSLALQGEYSRWAFDEERAPLNKGRWRSQVFEKDSVDHPLDLEIGTGNGLFFLHQAKSNLQRSLVGIEIKYKPLIQSIRRTRAMGLTNASICRFHAFNIDYLFEKEEINDIYIFFPDPWVAPRKPQNRLFQPEVLQRIFEIQKPGSKLFLKTDSREYFDWSLDQVQKSPYRVVKHTYDLHAEPQFIDNYITAFEKIFMRQQIPINAMILQKP